MEDLDLDELDQAVNKMMAKPSSKKPDAKSAEQIEEPEQTVRSVQDAAKAEEAPVNTQRPVLQVPSRRRTHPGAMDIMPAAQKPQQTAPPSARPGRVAANMTPVEREEPKKNNPRPRFMNDVFLPQKPKSESPAQLQEPEKPEESPVKEAEPKQVSAPPAYMPEKPEDKKVAGTGWPDPLDYLDYDQTKAKQTTGPDEPKQSAQPEPTPFVTTKVEKRPLGAYTQIEPEAASEKLEEPEPSVAPPETDKKEMASASLQSQQHLDDGPDLRQMAIPQQYRAEDSTPSEEIRSVYDTKEYHAPPQPMYGAHKSGPWFVIGMVALITLLVVVVLIGYFMMTGAFNF